MKIAKFILKEPVHCIISGQFISTESWIHSKRTMDCYELIIGLKGTIYLEQDEVQYEINPGDIMLVLPGHHHGGYKSVEKGIDLSFYWFHFYYKEPIELVEDKELMDKLKLLKNNPYSNNLEDIAYIPIHSNIKDISKINIIARQLLDFCNTRYYTNRILDFTISTLIIEISHQLLKQATNVIETTQGELIFNEILEWLKINALNEMSLKDVAYKFNFNKNYLTKMFKKKTGVTVNDYIINIRIDRAKALLLQTNLTIKEVAYKVGYQDEKYFMRVFKGRELITPSKYRNTFCHTFTNSI